jgi:hypothetical protein
MSKTSQKARGVLRILGLVGSILTMLIMPARISPLDHEFCYRKPSFMLQNLKVSLEVSVPDR